MSQVNANQAVLLYDGSGNPISSSGGALSVTGVAGGAIPSNIQKWGGATVDAAIADAPVGTEIAPVVRDILRKKTTVLSRTPLLGNAIFQSAWFDTELTGEVYVVASARSDQAGSNLQILECDDISGTTFTAAQIQSSIQSVAYSANTATRVPGVIRQRYYAIVFQNGATPQTTFELTVCASNFMVPGALTGGVVSTGALGVNPMPVFVNVGGGGVGADAVVNINDIPGTAGAFPMRNAIHEFNGTNWDRIRGNWNTTTGDTGAKLVSFAGATQTNFDAIGAYITVLLSTVSGTGPTLTAQLQYSLDAGTTWLNLGPASATVNTTGNTILIAIHPTNLSQAAGTTPVNLTTGATTQVMLNAPLPRTWRLNYVIAGTNPSFTFSSVGVNYIRG